MHESYLILFRYTILDIGRYALHQNYKWTVYNKRSIISASSVKLITMRKLMIKMDKRSISGKYQLSHVLQNTKRSKVRLICTHNQAINSFWNNNDGVSRRQISCRGSCFLQIRIKRFTVTSYLLRHLQMALNNDLIMLGPVL